MIHDFANYYFGGYFLSEGIFNPTIYFPYQFNKVIADYGYQNIFVSYAPNPPFLSILFYPLSWLQITTSKLIFNILGSCLFLFSIIRLTYRFKIKKEYILLLPIIFFIPIKNNLLFGQVYFLLFFLLSEGFLAYQKKHYKTMAILWSLAIFIKVFPIILVGFLLFKKEFIALKYLITCCIILFLFSISINGYETWIFYFIKVLPRASNGEIAGAFVDNYQSFYMFFKRIFIYDEIYNKNALTNLPIVFYAIILGIKLFLMGVGIFITRIEQNSIFIFSFWIISSILISPYGSTYTFILLIFMFISFCESRVNFKHKLIGLSLLFLIANSKLIPEFSFPLNYLRLFFLSVLLFFLIWKYKKEVPFKKLIVSIILLTTLISLFKTKKTQYNVVLKTPISTYDYMIENNKISYYFWNENGSNMVTKKYSYQSLDTSFVKIKNNQIFYKNKQITFDNSNKKKAVIINNQKIIFLSDTNNGIGFYSINQLNL